MAKKLTLAKQIEIKVLEYNKLFLEARIIDKKMEISVKERDIFKNKRDIKTFQNVLLEMTDELKTKENEILEAKRGTNEK